MTKDSDRLNPPLVSLNRKSIRAQNDTDKRNPNSIRYLIGILIKLRFDSNIRSAASQLSKFSGRYKAPRGDVEYKTLGYKSLNGILDDDDFVSYWHLECIARYLKIPTGALLLLSRAAMARKSGRGSEIEALAEGCRHLAYTLDKMKDGGEMTSADFDLVTKCFERLQESEISPSIFDVMHER